MNTFQQITIVELPFTSEGLTTIIWMIQMSFYSLISSSDFDLDYLVVI